jgi:hypothetical protein
MSGVTVAYSQHLVILFVRRLTTLPLCWLALACGGLSSDYDWNGVGIKEFKVFFVNLIFPDL